jgi:hypothetical protein
VLSHHVDAVSCRWCGHGHSVVELAESETGGSDVGPGEQEHQEPGAASRVT